MTNKEPNKLEITEEQKQAFLDAIGKVEAEHGLQLCALLHRIETQQKSSHEAVLGIREYIKSDNNGAG